MTAGAQTATGTKTFGSIAFATGHLLETYEIYEHTTTLNGVVWTLAQPITLRFCKIGEIVSLQTTAATYTGTFNMAGTIFLAESFPERFRPPFVIRPPYFAWNNGVGIDTHIDVHDTGAIVFNGQAGGNFTGGECTIFGFSCQWHAVPN